MLNIIIIIGAIAAVISTIISAIKNGSAIKRFLKSLMAKAKIYQWRNSYIERKNHKKAQKILNEKITRAELINITKTICETTENIVSITRLTLCMLIQAIDKPDNKALFSYMHRRGYGAEYNINNIERWVNCLWQARSDGTITGEIKELENNIKLLNNKIEELNTK